MKRKGLIVRLAVLAVVLCLVTMSLTAGTLAKYASEFGGTATATVAKWAVAFKDGEGTTFSKSKPLALTLNDAAKVTDKLVTENKIAPGTSGSFALQVDGTGTEVAFDYTVELNLTSISGLPVKFYSDNTFNTELTKTDNKVSVTGTVMVGETATATQNVYWKWDSTGIGTGTEDERDTALGVAAQTFEIPATIRAEQRLEKPATSGS